MMDGFYGVRPRTIYVIPEQDPGPIRESLEREGFVVSPDASSAAYVLRVDVGARRATKACGTVNNVRYRLGSDLTNAYELSRTEITKLEARPAPTSYFRILEVTARGPTGGCRPNVYDEMSAALRASFPPEPTP